MSATFFKGKDFDKGSQHTINPNGSSNSILQNNKKLKENSNTGGMQESTPSEQTNTIPSRRP